MTFASAYLRSAPFFPTLIEEEPRSNTGLIVVIPAYNEPEITRCLSSLAACSRVDTAVEVLIIVNAPASASPEAVTGNSVILKNIELWRGKQQELPFRLYVIDCGMPQVKKWGVGTARKTGMDEAVRRFDAIGNSNGVIASLDADCVVSVGYIRALCEDFGNNTAARACSIYFMHPDGEEDLPVEVKSAIRKYELHLRYFINALRYTGFPHCHHTIGSAMAVKAADYVSTGGMNRREGGEDFYFIQKLAARGGLVDLNMVTVYPSPRKSSRVPFGTGPAVAGIIESGISEYFTYNTRAFIPLKLLFAMVVSESTANSPHLLRYNTLPVEIQLFIEEGEWSSRIDEIRANTAGGSAFIKRFYNWFNAFRIVKYLNFIHRAYFEKIPVSNAATLLLKLSGKECPPYTTFLLEYYRKLDRFN